MVVYIVTVVVTAAPRCFWRDPVRGPSFRVQKKRGRDRGRGGGRERGSRGLRGHQWIGRWHAWCVRRRFVDPASSCSSDSLLFPQRVLGHQQSEGTWGFVVDSLDISCTRACFWVSLHVHLFCGVFSRTGRTSRTSMSQCVNTVRRRVSATRLSAHGRVDIFDTLLCILTTKRLLSRKVLPLETVLWLHWNPHRAWLLRLLTRSRHTWTRLAAMLQRWCQSCSVVFLHRWMSRWLLRVIVGRVALSQDQAWESSCWRFHCTICSLDEISIPPRTPGHCVVLTSAIRRSLEWFLRWSGTASKVWSLSLTSQTNELAAISAGYGDSSLLVAKWLRGDASSSLDLHSDASTRKWHVIVVAWTAWNFVLGSSLLSNHPIAAQLCEVGSCSELQCIARSALCARLFILAAGRQCQQYKIQISQQNLAKANTFSNQTLNQTRRNMDTWLHRLHTTSRWPRLKISVCFVWWGAHWSSLGYEDIEFGRITFYWSLGTIHKKLQIHGYSSEEVEMTTSLRYSI